MCLDNIFGKNPHEVTKAALNVLMKMHADDARSLYRLCVNHNLQDTQEFINWQDELNDISVKYE
jgi:hypothetical protein